MPVWAWAVGIGFLYGLLVFLKGRSIRAVLDALGRGPRALVNWPLWSRALSSGVLLGAAVVLGLATTYALSAALLLVGASTLSVYLPASPGPVLRGPGQWKTVDLCKLDVGQAPKKVGSGVLDASRPLGFLVFVLGLAGLGYAVALLFTLSPYRGALAGLGLFALVPLFCTGRTLGGENALELSRRVLRRIEKRLARERGLELEALGRLPTTSRRFDELRLRVMPRHARVGLRSIELGLELHAAPNGPIALPVVLVRALDGSESYRTLPRHVVWTRGRSPDERVAIIRARLPGVSEAIRLAMQTLAALSAGNAPQVRSDVAPSKVRKASGMGKRKRNPGTRSSPAHAM
jgi:hypothetical protein